MKPYPLQNFLLLVVRVVNTALETSLLPHCLDEVQGFPS